MRWLFVITMILAASIVRAQGLADTLRARLERQYYEYPQEKIHITTDRNHYMGGDTIWLRGHVVSASTHEPVAVSKYMYVELRSPYNTVEQRIKVIERGGVYAGYIPLDLRIPEGDYTIVAYTNFMNSAGEAYFFKKPVGIRTAYSLRLNLSARFEWEEGDKRLMCRISYKDRSTNEERERTFTYRTVKDADWKPSWKRKGVETIKLDRDEYLAGYLLVMCDEYAKYIRLPRSVAEYDVTFHPEGGYVVPGEACRVAFKAIDSYGMGIPIAGIVTDSLGNEVTRFNSLHAGMGSFTFVPQPGMCYRANCVAPRSGVTASFDLPEANPEAAVISADIVGDTLIDISVKGNCPDDAIVAIQERGLLIYATTLDNSMKLRVRCNGLQEGILQVLLLDGGLHPLSERLLFARTEHADSTCITPSRPYYENRDKVTLTIDLDGYADPSGSVAVAVTDDMFGDESGSTNILANLLLQSELRGYVENPAYYFERDDTTRRRALDALMMTQGWRRYDIPASLRGELQYPSAAIEKSQEISGTVKSLWRGKPLDDATVKILAKRIGFARAVPTDSLGRFRFNGFDNIDGVGYQLEAINSKGDTESNVEIDPELFPDVAPIDAKADYERPAETKVTAQHDNAERMRLSASGTYNIILNELVVEAHKPDQEGKDVTELLAHRSFDSEFIEKRNYTSIEEVIRLISGIRITPQGNLIYRNFSVGVVIDGVPLYSAYIGDDGSTLQMKHVVDRMRDRRIKSMMSQDISELSQRATKRALTESNGNTVASSFGILREVEAVCPFQLIERIDFLQPGAAVIYGNEFFGGALVITTKDGADIEPDKPYGIKYFNPLGYQQPAEFYSPKYAHATGNTSDGTDSRSTVYWSPDVQIDKTGTATIEFYANDIRRTRYSVLVEGVTSSGDLVHTIAKIRKE